MTRTLLCYGDSNTHGTLPMPTLDALGRYDRDTRWPGQLQKLLPDWHVIEEGHPGRTTVHDDPIEGPHRNGLTVLPSILESHREIDAVILMLGTNDLKGRFSLNATDIALALEKLVLVIKASLAGPKSHPARHPSRRAAADPRGRSAGRNLLGRCREIAAPWRAHRRLGQARRGAVSRRRAPHLRFAHRRHPLRRGRTGHPRPGLRRGRPGPFLLEGTRPCSRGSTTA